MSHLTELERWTIIAYRNEGKSFGSIAEELGHSKSTVARTMERFEETKSVGDRTRKRTRSKLGGLVGQEIEETMEGKVGMSTRRMAKKLRVEHDVPISHMGVNKFLHAEGLEPHSRPTCTPLTDSQKRKRVEWCERFKNKRVSWWRKVVFLDEKTFGATWPGNRKNDIVWGRKRTIIPPRGVQAYQPSVKVGVALCYEGKSRAYELPPWSGPAYNKMVRELVIPFSQRHFHGENVVLFQDNDPSHLTAHNKRTMRAAGFQFEGDYKFPPNSGDLNPVENLWSILLTNMEGAKITTHASLVAAIHRAMRRVKRESLRAMINSMPARLRACLEGRGERTKW